MLPFEKIDAEEYVRARRSIYGNYNSVLSLPRELQQCVGNLVLANQVYLVRRCVDPKFTDRLFLDKRINGLLYIRWWKGIDYNLCLQGGMSDAEYDKSVKPMRVSGALHDPPQYVKWTVQSHREAHQSLHQHLDTLLADYMFEADGRTTHSIFKLMEWSYEQTKNPSNRRGNPYEA